jgi:hypothetical protein
MACIHAFRPRTRTFQVRTLDRRKRQTTIVQSRMDMPHRRTSRGDVRTSPMHAHASNGKRNNQTGKRLASLHASPDKQESPQSGQTHTHTHTHTHTVATQNCRQKPDRITFLANTRAFVLSERADCTVFTRRALSVWLCLTTRTLHAFFGAGQRVGTLDSERNIDDACTEEDKGKANRTRSMRVQNLKTKTGEPNHKHYIHACPRHSQRFRPHIIGM